ncbi:MAG: cytochrome c3 family protein, partial [Pseudomonadota bacterium]
GPQLHLLNKTCVGCHSSSKDEYHYDLGGETVPIVFHTSGAPANDIGLAGGDFYWVANGGGEGGEVKDRYGHNVYGISPRDTTISDNYAKQWSTECVTCHSDLSSASCTEDGNMKGHPGGCQGCHLYPRHHHKDKDTETIKRGYRMLHSHASPAPAATDDDNVKSDNYVIGYEDSDYEETSSKDDHNEYQGYYNWLSTEDVIGRLKTTHSITDFCSGCHRTAEGDVYWDDSSSPPTLRRKTMFWSASLHLKHPADVRVYPSLDQTDYNPLVPVARNWDLTRRTSSTNYYTSYDLVMCLTCHRAHGSKYPHMLRWEYSEDKDQAKKSSTTGSCRFCHVDR